MEESLNSIVLKEGTSRVYQCIDRQYIYNLTKTKYVNLSKWCVDIFIYMYMYIHLPSMIHPISYEYLKLIRIALKKQPDWI